MVAPVRLRRFLHLEGPRPGRPAAPAPPAGLEERFRALLADAERRAASGDRPEDDPPELRWLRRRWW